MKTFTASLLFAAATASGIVPDHLTGGAVKASKVCVDNSAGFVLNFWFDDLVTGDKSAPTENYPIDQYKCLSIADALPETAEGDIVMTYVKAILGTTRSVDTAISFDSTAPTVTFTCTGTTLDYDCKMNGEDMELAKYYADLLKMVFHDYDKPEIKMPDAPGEFLAGYIYGVSWQQDDIRDALMSCIKFDEDLTNDMYEVMADQEKGDFAAATKKMSDAQKLYKKDLASCDAKVTDVLDSWQKKMEDLVARPDYVAFQAKVYKAHKKEIDDNFHNELKWWDAGVFFNSGMFAGRNDKIFLDSE